MLIKQNYIAIAGVVNNSYTKYHQANCDAECVAISFLANDLADYFASDNPNFDQDLFLVACGIE